MIVHQLSALKQQVAWPYRPLCQSATIAYSSFMRWKGRVARSEPAIRRSGPKPVGPLDLAALQQQLRGLDHGRQRTTGTTALYDRHRHAISRRAFQQLLEATRREVLQERTAQLRRIHWNVAGAVWSMDPTELVLTHNDLRHKLHLLPLLDLASRYKFPPLLGERVCGERVAARLEELFAEYGPPLVLKRDNGSNLNHHAVDDVLARWLVIPLNSPPHYPPYNGGMERAQRELKNALRPKLAAAGDGTRAAGLVLLTVHELNHRPRRCLRGHTACELFAGAKQNLSGYTRRRRKESFEQIRELAMNILAEMPVRTTPPADAAWRQAVETWLQQQGIITISEPKSVTQFL
jgi:hypothetical protein